MNSNKIVDVERILRQKNEILAKWMPRFLMNYLRKIAHQDDLNKIFNDTKGKLNLDFCEAIFSEFNLEVKTVGIENIPKTGGAIFAANHPLGGLDALALMLAIDKVRKDVKFITNDILLNVKPLRSMLVGVNKYGRNDPEALNELTNVFASEQAVFIFPAGLVSRRKKGVIKDLNWKSTFIKKAKRHNSKIVPVHLDGQLSNFFYRLSNFREKIGIKANIELFYLINETFKQRNRKITITFGAPIEPSIFDKTKKDADWANWTRDRVYQLVTQRS